MEIVVEPGYEGDIVVEVGGTAGLSGELTVAKAITPVSITASAKPVVKVGTISEAGTLTITENKAEAIGDDSDDQIIVDLPQGVRWAATPTVKVTSGDLDIDEGNVKTQKDGEEDDNQLVIPIETSSTEPSTIEISNIKYIVDRTVPEGDIKVKVQGPAVVETKSDSKTADYFADIRNGSVYIDSEEAFDLESGHLFDKTGTAASTVNATVATPGAGGQTASFIIGSTTYTVNGVEATMDVAAYTKDGRTYLPVRYVAYALGITPENILWDGKTATFIGNGRVVQATPGSSVLTINGAPVTMDVPTENVNGRVMVPFRWVAQVFGAQVNYDDATQTVTMTL
ncbi:Cu2+-containing amine oxidase [Moorella thermoacetica Y72]|uniref:Cu2+-containing amine oxidase n=1 Tax=Moorella thermoacetica Y72 TaxID=1325331 RepID=A0A0S6UDT8_NEOTH|nr:copper amine oxidase N-terminal domain-containing protein [Moorella thermoacetica]GAF25574.1 Cu2+-containing amine oxidase [Moorella thermoacetica Y72]